MPGSSSTDWTTVEVEVSGLPITIRKAGTGPDVVFVHGVYVNGHVWDDVVDHLSRTHTCWVPTLPLGGHDHPMAAGWSPTLETLADLVPGLLDALGLTRATVVGNDSGGGLVLLSLASPASGLARIARLVLTNCDSYDHPSSGH
jgi:pimeloyl-ACP methyl ester carboxylesterase